MKRWYTIFPLSILLAMGLKLSLDHIPYLREPKNALLLGVFAGLMVGVYIVWCVIEYYEDDD